MELFPDPPPWLIPLTLTFFGIALVVGTVFFVLYLISARRNRAEMRARMLDNDWVDLAEFNPKKDHRRVRSPKVVREEGSGAAKKKPPTPS